MKVIETTLGSGIEAVYPKGDVAPLPVVIMPNRAQIERGKRALGKNAGLLGIRFMTFDDIFESLALDRPRGEGRAIYRFRENLEGSGTVFSNLRDLQKVGALFRLMEAVDLRGVEFSRLPYSWRKEIPELLACMRKAKAEADCRTRAELVEEALKAPIYEKNPYLVFGMTDIKERERALLDRLDEAGGVTVVLPFVSEEDDEALCDLEEIWAPGEVRKVKVPSPEITCYTSVQRERTYRHMADQVYDALKADPSLNVGVIVSEKERGALSETFRLRGIPVAEGKKIFSEEGVLENLRLLWRLSDRIVDIAAYLRTPLATFSRGSALAAILEKLGIKRLSEWEDRKAYRLFLNEEERALFYDALPLLTEKIKTLPKTYGEFKRATEEVLHRFDGETARLLTEAMEREEGDYGTISGEEFESLLEEKLEEERSSGVRLISLRSGYGDDYDLLVVSNLDYGFARGEAEDDLVHSGIRPRLKPLGLFLDERSPSCDLLALRYAIASSRKSAIYKSGEGEASPLFTALVNRFSSVDLDDALEFFEREDYLQTADNLLSEAMGDHLRRSLREQSFSPSSVDLYRSCPFKFFVEKILKKDVEDRKGREMMTAGMLYHAVLEGYFKGDLSLQAIEGEVEDGFRRNLADLVPEPLWKIKIKTMTKALLSTIENEEARLEDPKKNRGFVPSRFEVEYSYPFRSYWIRGIIDRIDEDGRGGEILVDYKSRRVPAFSELANYEKMQLPMYALARRYLQKTPVSLEYVSVEEAKESVMLRNVEIAGSYPRLREERKFDGKSFSEFLDRAETALDETIRGIEEGRFFAEPSRASVCRYCVFSDICRKEN